MNYHKFYRTKYSSMAVAAAILAALSAGTYFYKTASPTENKVVMAEIKKANNHTPYNVLNGGLAQLDGDKIYYKKFNLETAKWCLYEMDTDGTSNKEIYQDVGNFLNIKDGIMYYSINYDTDGLNRIYKTSLDGTQKITLAEDSSFYFTDVQIVGDYIYYLRNSFNKEKLAGKASICRMKLDGSEKTELVCVDNIIDNLNVTDNGIYFVNYKHKKLAGDYCYGEDKDFNVYKTDLDGKNQTCILKNGDAHIDSLVVSDDSLYYIEATGQGLNSISKIYKTNIDGNDKKFIADGCSINIDDNYIYYINHNEVHKVNKSTLENTLVTQFSGYGNINIAGDYILV